MYIEQNGELPSIATPETSARQQVAELMGPAEPEQRNSPGSSVPADQSNAASAAMTAPTMAPPMLQVDEPVAVPQVAGTPVIADDVDLIEKEWVDKAKQIVEMTNGEPYEQKQEMSRLKADYLHKRYNKVLKVDNASSGS